MQQNTPVTPQMAELGAAVIAAVQAILADPDAAHAAVKARADAVRLTEDEIAKAEDARATIAQAVALDTEFTKRKAELDRQSDLQKQMHDRLEKEYEIHTTNVNRFAESVRIYNDDVQKHDEDKRQLAAQKVAFGNEYKELLDAQEENRKWEKDLLARENAFTVAAQSIGLKKSVKG